MITRNRPLIFFLASVLVVLVYLINAIFFGAFMIESFVGVVIGNLYVIIDTQIMIARAESGTFDVWSDAKELFIDLFKLFYNICRILLNNSEKKKD